MHTIGLIGQDEHIGEECQVFVFGLACDRGHALGVTSCDNTWEWRDVWIGQRDKAHGALHDLKTTHHFQFSTLQI